MRSLEQSLIDYPLAFLRVIAELRGISLQGQSQREAAEELAAVLGDPAVVAQALDELSPDAMRALEALAAAGGYLQATLFQKRYGEIRPIGPGRLARERPWESPTGPAEELWYRGWIFRGFVDVDGTITEVIYIPDEVLGLLPGNASVALEVPVASAPDAAVVHGDALVQDVTTVLAMISAEGIRSRRGEWAPADLKTLAERLLAPEVPPFDLSGGGRLALLLHLLGRLEWVYEGDDGSVRLRASRVRGWLEADRPEQWRALWMAWRDDDAWDDLRRLPELVCEGGWHDDPTGARRRLLAQMGRLQPGAWYRVDDWVAAIKAAAPDFLRPDGDYDSWYIRPADGSGYLRGFEHWDDVEGRLARYLLRGPFHWFGLVALDPESERFALTEAGRALIQGGSPPDEPPGDITVTRDFAVLVPREVSCLDRLRVARFTLWEASPAIGSDEPFRYRITRRSLRRAETHGITAGRVLAFLRDRVGDALPKNVARALERWPGRAAGR